MTKCNIILLEDNKQHRENLIEDLKAEYDHTVKGFRDLKTFRDACDEGDVLNGMRKGLPLIIIIDIMMTEELDEEKPFAPRFTGAGEGPDNPKEYVDDELGLKIAEDIRKGDFFKGIPKDVPILFFTARHDPDIVSQIKEEEMQPAFYLGKAAWIEDVQRGIIGLLSKAGFVDDKQG